MQLITWEKQTHYV